MTLENLMKKRFAQYDRFDVMRWLINGQRSINKNEQMSLLSLLAYTAVETDTPVEDLQGHFFESFHVARMDELKGDDYDDAVKFFMDWKAADAANRAVA